MAALIFDVDGTLAETERDGHRIAFNRAFDEAGLNWHWPKSFYGNLLSISGGKERVQYYMKHYCSQKALPNDRDRFVQALHQAKNKHYQQILQEGKIPLRLGVKRLLNAAKAAEIPLAIATTSSLENTTALLETHLETSYFDLIAAGDIVPNKKPAPDIYHYVLEKLDLSVEDCLVFEDSQAGLTAATKAGLKTVITFSEYTAKQDFSSAVLVLNHLGEPDQPFTVYRKTRDVTQPYFDLSLAETLLNL